MIKRLFFSVWCMLLFLLAMAQQPIITISNPLAVEREEVVVEIPWTQVMASYPQLDTTHFKVINAGTKKGYPFQLEYRGNKEVQNLLVQVSVPAKGRVQLSLVKGKRDVFAPKTFCRFVPERKDDFAWENDRIAHRMYGKALEKTPKELAYGVDVWVKRTDKLVINERYKRGKYHEDAGDGLDYYHVGLTLGAGGIAPYINDTIWYAGTYSDWRIWDNGPLRSTFQLQYDVWTAAGRKVKMTNTISIDAGSQLSQNRVLFETTDTLPLPFVTGIIKRKEAGAMLLNEAAGLMAYWEPQHGEDGTTGVACLLTTPVARIAVNKEQLLAVSTAQKEKEIIYYNGAAWDKGGKITSANSWFNYLQQFGDRLKNPLSISIK